MKLDRLIQYVKDELSRNQSDERVYQLLSLLSIIKDERIQELEKQLTKIRLEKYKRVA